MPLTRSANNPNYFALPDGTPVYLTGSHTWNNLQNEGSTFPPASLDYTGYVNWMQSNKFNFMRLWNIAEQPYSAAWTTSPWYTDPLPYARTGPGLAADEIPSSISTHSTKPISTGFARESSKLGSTVYTWTLCSLKDGASAQ